MASAGVIGIRDCSRGMSDWYPPMLDEDQIVLGENIEFWDGNVCGRRNGTVTVVGTANNAEFWGLGMYTPTQNAWEDRLAGAWRVAATGAYGVTLYAPDTYAATALGVNPDDHMDFSQGVDFASLHGKLFVAAKSDVNRLHVYDPVSVALRRSGIAAPTVGPGLAPVGSGGMSGTRRYRVRFARMIGGAPPFETVLRGEPSPEVAITVTNVSAVRVTVPAIPPGEAPGIGHWEVELQDPATSNWYRINTIFIGTPTYDDTLPIGQVATTGILSEDIGDNQLQHAAKWLTVDEDRLLLGGSWMDENLSARVAWTPLSSESGVGDDERLEMLTRPFIDFDRGNGGGLTGIKAWEGKVIVFKRGHVYQMVRSSSRDRAYISDVLSRRHGAIPQSVVEGTDVDGLPCLYFLDPMVGPMQYGYRGFRVLTPQMQRTWVSTINFNAAVPCSVAYNSHKRQVFWHVATGTSARPNLRWMYSVESDGLVYHTLPTPVLSALNFRGKPHLGLDLATPTVGIERADEPLRLTDWDGVKFGARLRTKAYQMGDCVRRFQIDSAVLEVGGAQPNDRLMVRCIRDFGQETRTLPVVITAAPSGNPSFLAIPIDNLYLTEGLSMQFEIGNDPGAVTTTANWQIYGMRFLWSLGSPSTGRG